jgi:hypothetical protein
MRRRVVELERTERTGARLSSPILTARIIRLIEASLSG